jgi:hypothetical protein
VITGDGSGPAVGGGTPGRTTPAATQAVPSAGDLFTVLWEALSDVLGTAAAATLLRRAAQRTAPRWPEVGALSIRREELEYCYTVPPAWKHHTQEPPQALCELARELCVLLVDLTGSVVVNRLAQIPELRDRGIVPQRKEQP